MVMARLGSRFFVEILHPTYGWVRFLGQQSSSGVATTEQVDITAKDLMPWRQLFNCGTRAVTLTCSGTFGETSFNFTGFNAKTFLNWCCTKAISDPMVIARVRDALFESWNEGEYLISAYTRKGDYNNAETYEITLESAGNLTSLNIPPYDAITRGASVFHGYSMRVLREGYYQEGGKCLRVRRESDNAELDIGFNSAKYIDKTQLTTFLNGAVGRVVKWYDQAPLTQTRVGSPPNPIEPRLDVGTSTASQQPYITNTSGVLLTTPDGTPRIQFRFPGEAFSINRNLTSPGVDWGVPAGNFKAGFGNLIYRVHEWRHDVPMVSCGFFDYRVRTIPSNAVRFNTAAPEGQDPEFLQYTPPNYMNIITGKVNDKVRNRAILNNGEAKGEWAGSFSGPGVSLIKFGANVTPTFSTQEFWCFLHEPSITTDTFLETNGRYAQLNASLAFGMGI